MNPELDLRSAAATHPGDDLLPLVQRRFYPLDSPHARRRFHRDRRMLLHALSWPAVWLEERGLTCPPSRYRSLLAERLDAIAAHGDPARYDAFFPAYLLKCLQDWFLHHGSDLYSDLKHIRNALDHVLSNLRFSSEVRRDAHHLAVLAAAHRLIASRHTSPTKNSSPRQLSLPLH